MDLKGNKKGIGFKYAWAGLVVAFKKEKNLRIQIIVALIILTFGFLLQLKQLEWLFIILAITLVIMSELINSVVERLIDYLKPERNFYAKQIKDISAGFVLITVISAVVIGLIIFLPKLMDYI